MLHGHEFPPTIPGVTQDDRPPPDLMSLLAKMLSADSGNAAQALDEGMKALRKAAELDPRYDKPVGAALRALVQGAGVGGGGCGMMENDHMGDQGGQSRLSGSVLWSPATPGGIRRGD